MKLDDTTKIVSLVSAIMTIVIALAGFVIDWRLKETKSTLEAAVAKVESDTKQLTAKADADAKRAETDNKLLANADKEADLEALLTVAFDVPTARAFTSGYRDAHRGNGVKTVEPLFPTTDFLHDMERSMDKWGAGNELMTGDACKPPGLLLRQIITLTIANHGNAHAKKVTVNLWKKEPVQPNAYGAWALKSDENKPIHYSDIMIGDDERPVGSGWVKAEVPADDLLGNRSKDKGQSAVTIVLASVSGGDELYGTIFVPASVSWTDSITRKQHDDLIMKYHASRIRTILEGARLGRVGSAHCG